MFLVKTQIETKLKACENEILYEYFQLSLFPFTISMSSHKQFFPGLRKRKEKKLFLGLKIRLFSEQKRLFLRQNKFFQGQRMFFLKTKMFNLFEGKNDSVLSFTLKFRK